jgi:uncharacterized membrane protein
VLVRRWRLIAGGATALTVGLAASLRFGFPAGLGALAGWNAGGLVYLLTTGWMLWKDDESTVRRRACDEDESPHVTQTIVLSAVVASLAAAVLAMRESKAAAHAPVGPSWTWLLSIVTLALSWLIVQAVFTLRYAHRYFGDGDRDGEPDGGVQFPGEAPTTYHDFVYMSVCIGASAQVSDFNITTSRLRRLVTVHSVLAFFFNTMILALGINILATVISG